MQREWMLVTGSSSLSTGGRAAVFRNGARCVVPEARVTRVTLTNAESVPRLVPGASAGRPGRRDPTAGPGRDGVRFLTFSSSQARSRREGARPMSTATENERELIFASFEDAAMGAVAEKALREWERQVESITLGNIAVVTRDAEGEVHVHQAGHLSPRRGALFGLITGALLGAAMIGVPLGVAIGTAAGIQATAVAAGTLASAAAGASSTTLAIEAALATGLGAAMSG